MEDHREMSQHSHNATRRRGLSLVYLFGFALLAVSMAGAGWMMRSNAGPANGGQALGDGTASAVIHCIGHVDVESGVTFPYPVAPGRVVEVKVREGQVLKAGEVLFRMDDRTQRKDVERAEAAVSLAGMGVTKAVNDADEHAKAVQVQSQAVEVARRNVEVAQLAARRKRKAANDGGLVKEEAEAAELLAKTAEATVKLEEDKLEALKARAENLALARKRAEAEVADAKLLLDKAKLACDECVVKAPTDGSVLRLAVQVGDLLPPEAKSPPVVFCPAEQRIIRAEVEQEWAGRVQDGMIATIEDETSSSNGPTWKGKVVRCGDWMAHRRSILPDPAQFHDVRTLECIIALDPDQPRLRIGQRVRIALSNP
jgi:multidrug resistance efflux pump